MTTPALAQNVKGKGRHYEHPETKLLLPSVTNVLGMLAKPALVGWAARTVAELAADLRDSLPKMEHAEVVTLLKGAASRTGNKAATRGTDVHAFLEARLCGYDTPPLDEAAEQYREAVEMFLEHERPERIATEITMFTHGYAGTADAVVRIGGRTCLIDYKTSKAVYPEASLQLAALCSGTLWHDGTQIIEPVPIDELIVVRIGIGEYELGYVRDPSAALSTFHALLTVWHWHHSTDKHYKEDADDSAL